MEDLENADYWGKLSDDIASGKYDEGRVAISPSEAQKEHQLIKLAILGNELESTTEQLDHHHSSPSA